MIPQISRIAAVLKGAFGFVTANRDPVTGGIGFLAAGNQFNVMKRRPLLPRPTALTTDVPTITYSATLPSSGRAVPPVYPNVRPVGCVPQYNTSTTVYDLLSQGAFAGIDCILVGDSLSFVWKCDVSTKERFMFYVDGNPVSLSPATPTVSTSAGAFYVVTLAFGSVARRRIEIIGTAIKSFVRVVIPISSQISSAPKKRSIHIVGDSFNAGSNAISTNDQLPGGQIAMAYDASVSVNAYGGTGYVKTNGSFVTFGDASRISHAAAIQPDDIVFMGSVNDDGQAGVQAAASACFAAYKAACPKANIVVFGPQATNSTDTISANRRDNCLAVRAAAVASLVPYYEMCGFIDSSAISAFATFTFYQPGQLVTYLGAIWKHEATAANQYPGSGAPGQPGYQAWSLQSSGLYGTGKVGSTTGDGSRDTLLYSDNIHPMPTQCQMLGLRMASVLSDMSDF